MLFGSDRRNTGMRTEAVERVGAVAARKPSPGFGPAQVDYLEALVELAREGREDRVFGTETLFVGKNAGSFHTWPTVFVNVVDKARCGGRLRKAIQNSPAIAG